MRISSSYFTKFTIQEMNDRQVEIAQLQEDISSGKKLHKPSDDPALVARTQTIESSMLRLEQFQKNTNAARQRIGLEEDTLGRVTDLIQRTQELALQAKSGTVTAEKLQAYGAEVQQHFNELVDYGNTRNANGEFIFAGRMGRTRPFALENNQISYDGDHGQIEVQIGSSRKVAASNSGDKVFMNISTGNGRFSVDSDPANTGTGVLGTGSVSNNSIYEARDFSIEFTSPTTFDVKDDTGAVIQSGNYQEHANISFNGMNVRLSGTPETGDKFYTKPSVKQDLFSVLDTFIQAAKVNPGNSNERAQLDQTLNSVIDSLDQAHIHINSERSEIGARLRYLDSADEENSSVDFLLKSTLSDMEDTDYAEAASKLQLEMTTLEAVRQTYSQIQGNSLFNYLR
ncbi:MAG: flagellar hook-associated protein FlgL [bacterium]